MSAGDMILLARFMDCSCAILFIFPTGPENYPKVKGKLPGVSRVGNAAASRFHEGSNTSLPLRF